MLSYLFFTSHKGRINSYFPGMAPALPHDNRPLALHILRYEALSAVQDGGRSSAEENPVNLLPHACRN